MTTKVEAIHSLVRALGADDAKYSDEQTIAAAIQDLAEAVEDGMVGTGGGGTLAITLTLVEHAQGRAVVAGMPQMVDALEAIANGNAGQVPPFIVTTSQDGSAPTQMVPLQYAGGGEMDGVRISRVTYSQGIAEFNYRDGLGDLFLNFGTVNFGTSELGGDETITGHELDGDNLILTLASDDGGTQEMV